MYWNGDRWLPQEPERVAKPAHRSYRRFRDWAATGIMVVVLAGLALPFGDADAATISGTTLIANWSADSSVSVVQESSLRVGYKGTWRLAYHKSYLGGKAKSTDLAGARAAFKFKGNGIAWVGPMGPTRGKAKVYIDGTLVTTVDTWAASFRPTRVLFQRTWKSIGWHTISLVTSGTAGRPTVALDAFVQRRGPKSTTTSSPAPTPTSSPAPSATPTPTPPSTTGPAWSDEFSSWSSAKWTAKKWTFNSTYRVDPSQVSVSGGVLSLTSKYEGGGSYVSGTVYSNRTFDHGYFEARVKWPKGTGFDSSFWMVREGTISPRPEIDIIEAYPYDPYVYPGPNRYQATMHYMSGGVLRHHQFTYDAGQDLTNEWHRVGVEWIPGKRMTFYFDGVSIGSVAADVLPAQPMNAIFSQIISSWPAPPDSTTPTLATMQVDWVRWWDAKP